MSAVITTEGLTKTYGSVTAVDRLSFEVPEGKLVGFVGPNGAGKSTTMRLLVGLIRSTRGSATVLGHPIDRPQRYLPDVGALIEGPVSYPELTGRRNLEVLATLAGSGHEHIDAVLERVGLTGREDDRVSGYSMGMRQRLAIAGTLLSGPKLLLLDEPVNGLDPAGIREVRQLLRDIRAEGRSVFVSSHLLAELELLCDWFVIINHGGLVYQGTLEDLNRMQRPRLVVATEEISQLEIVSRIAVAAGFTVEPLDGRLVVDAPLDYAGPLNRRAMELGATLVELRPEATSLEDIVLDITATGDTEG